MNRIRTIIQKAAFGLLSASVLAFSGCGSAPAESAPKLADDPKGFYKAWDEAALAAVDTEAVKSRLAAVFPEQLNMEANSGLIDPEAFTGPILCYSGDNDYRFRHIYIPDQSTEEYLAAPMIPEDAVLAEYTCSAERLPAGYLSDEKLTQLKNNELPVVFVMVECTGYESSATYYYPSGNDVEVYWPGWRVSFYSYPDCELLGWETAARPYSRPEAMSGSGTVRDSNGKEVHLNDASGRIVDVMDLTMEMLYGPSYGQVEETPQPEQSEDGLSTYSYNDDGTVKREDVHDESGALTEYIEYGYHAEGFLVTKTGYGADGVKRWHMIFRSDGSVTSLSTFHANGNYDTSISYDREGNVTEIKHFDEEGNLIDG